MPAVSLLPYQGQNGRMPNMPSSSESPAESSAAPHPSARRRLSPTGWLSGFLALTLVTLCALALVAWRRPGLLGLKENVMPVQVIGAPAPLQVTWSEDGTRVLAVGDIACGPRATQKAADRGYLNSPDRNALTRWECGQAETGALAQSLEPTAILALGDLQYRSGTASEFAEFYDASWGQFRSITYPTIGNHEWRDDGKGYFGYFGPRVGNRQQSWYSTQIGSWKVVSLDSNCDRVDCSASGPQARWLEQELTASDALCTIAIYHHPLFSTSAHGDTPELKPLAEILYRHSVELALSGHDHVYERHVPMRPDGTVDEERGIRAFTVGTGGKGHYKMNPSDTTQAADNTSFGVLALDLAEDSYRWQFVPTTEDGFTDQGTAMCR